MDCKECIHYEEDGCLYVMEEYTKSMDAASCDYFVEKRPPKLSRVLQDLRAEIKDYCDDQYQENEYPSDYSILSIIDKYIETYK